MPERHPEHAFEPTPGHAPEHVPERSMKADLFLVTCEHGGNRIPSRYRPLFRDHEALLPTHRGYDAGALRLAKEMAAALAAPVFAATVSRLLIDLNRSLIHPDLYSEATRPASEAIRREIWQRYYLPYRTKVETRIEQAYSKAERVIHLSCHTFAAELDGTVRDADIGLLYDPARRQEAAFCQRWREALREAAPSLRVRMNYPYSGKSDGFTTALRRRHEGKRYLGIELEVNQRNVFAGPRHWRATRGIIIDALLAAVAAQTR
jgi:predicted N-formylglutamate amidohydrolase